MLCLVAEATGTGCGCCYGEGCGAVLGGGTFPTFTILAINVPSLKPNSSLQGGPRHLSANGTTRATNTEFATAKGGYGCFPTGQARDGSCTQAFDTHSPRHLSTLGAIPVPGSAGKSSATIGRRVATRARPGATSSTTANVWVRTGMIALL